MRVNYTFYHLNCNQDLIPHLNSIRHLERSQEIPLQNDLTLEKGSQTHLGFYTVIPVKTGIHEIKELLHIGRAQSSDLLDPGLNPG